MSATVIKKTGENDQSGLGVAGAQVEIKATNPGNHESLVSSIKQKSGVTIPGSGGEVNNSISFNQGSKVNLSGQTASIVAN